MAGALIMPGEGYLLSMGGLEPSLNGGVQPITKPDLFLLPLFTSVSHPRGVPVFTCDVHVQSNP